MGHRFDVGAFSDQHRRMGMAEVVRAYRAEAGVGAGQLYAATDMAGVLELPKLSGLVAAQCSLWAICKNRLGGEYELIVMVQPSRVF